MGYTQRRNFCRANNKLNFKGFFAYCFIYHPLWVCKETLNRLIFVQVW